MRVIIAGSRGFNDYELLCKKCTEFIPDLEEEKRKNPLLCTSVNIISGNAAGADTLGKQFAMQNKLSLSVFKPDWKKYNKSAGFIRNEAMAKFAKGDEKCLLIAFWDGKSKGTKHMIDVAAKAGIETKIVNYLEGKKEDETFSIK
jgi:hypothetical protein